MINCFRLIRNVGTFDSAAPSAVAFAPLTLIYAENGRGKTTLTAILRSMASGDARPVAERHRLGATHPPHVIADYGAARAQTPTFQNGAWSQTVPEVSVFDDTFVDQNVYSGLVVGPEHRQNLHELILGTRGVALVRELQERVDEIERHNQALREKSSAIPTAARGSYSVEAFCALEPRAEVESELDEIRRKIDAAAEKIPIRDTAAIAGLTMPAFDPDTVHGVLATTLAELDQDAAAKVQAHLGRQGTGAQSWVEQGLSRIEHGEGQACPFCAQDLQGSPVLAHYRAYFSESYARLKRSVQSALATIRTTHHEDVPADLERQVSAINKRRQFWSRFCELPALEIDTAPVTAAWRNARDHIIAALDAKHATPLDAHSLSEAAQSALREYAEQTAELSRLNAVIAAANEAIALVKEQAAGADTAALAKDLAALEALKSRYEPSIARLCDALLEERARKVATEARRERAKRALDLHRVSAFPGYETAINLYLSRLNADYRVDQVTATNTRGGPACTYNVLINSLSIPVSGGATRDAERSFRNTLSAGDRNSLALAFFFASLDGDPDLADRIIVIDDPVSSLDEHRTLATAHEIRRLTSKARQVIVLSHSRAFLCRVWSGADPDSTAAMEIIRDRDGSTLAPWAIDRDALTEHDRRHVLLRDFLDGGGADPRETAQSIRPLLEAFIRVAYPQHFGPGVLLGAFRGVCAQRVGTAEEVLDAADTLELRELVEYANLFHHETNPAWQTAAINETELRGFVRRALDFTRR